MTIKELKEFVNNIPEKYDDLILITDYPDQSEYRMGDSWGEVYEMETYPYAASYYFIKFFV